MAPTYWTLWPSLTASLTSERDSQVAFAHTRRAQQQEGVAVGHPPAGGQLTDLSRVDRRLGLEIERLQRAHIREARQPQRHLHAQLVLAGHLRGADPRQGFPEVHLTPCGFLQQRIKAVADRRQPQAGEHRLQLLRRHRWRRWCRSAAGVGAHAATTPINST
jgi:hypothetical protein